jgi:transposase
MGLEIIEVVERRRRWPVEVRLRILDEVLQPGASITVVADRHGVARGLVYQWLRQLREGRMPGLSLKPEATSIFTPVRVVTQACETPANPPPRAAVEPAPAAPSPKRRTSVVEVTLGNGRVIKADEGIDPASLGAIIAALDGGHS